MAIAFRALSNFYSQSPTSGVSTFNINKPTGTTTGDVLVWVVVWGQSAVPNTPTGWTLARRSDSGYCNGAVYWKAAGGSEPTTYTMTASTARPMASGMICYSGVDTVDPLRFGPSLAVGTSSATSPTPAPFSGVVAGDVSLIAYLIAENASKLATSPTLTLPGGWTQRVYENSLSTAVNPVAIRVNEKAAGTDTPTCSTNINGDWMVLNMTLQVPQVAVDQGGFFF